MPKLWMGPFEAMLLTPRSTETYPSRQTQCRGPVRKALLSLTWEVDRNSSQGGGFFFDLPDSTG